MGVLLTLSIFISTTALGSHPQIVCARALDYSSTTYPEGFINSGALQEFTNEIRPEQSLDDYQEIVRAYYENIKQRQGLSWAYSLQQIEDYLRKETKSSTRALFEKVKIFQLKDTFFASDFLSEVLPNHRVPFWKWLSTYPFVTAAGTFQYAMSQSGQAIILDDLALSAVAATLGLSLVPKEIARAKVRSNNRTILDELDDFQQAMMKDPHPDFNQWNVFSVSVRRKTGSKSKLNRKYLELGGYDFLFRKQKGSGDLEIMIIPWEFDAQTMIQLEKLKQKPTS